MLELKEWADEREAARQYRVQFEYKLQKNQDRFERKNQKLRDFYEATKYNPRYKEEKEKYMLNLEALKAYYRYLDPK